MSAGPEGRDDAPAGQGADVALVLTPIPRPRFLTALCAVNRVRGAVLETSGGPIAVLEDPSPESARAAARAISVFLRGAEFLLAESRAGTVRVGLWKAGEEQRELPAGLALNDAPGVVTSLLTGVQGIRDLEESHPGKVHSTAIGRLAAYRELLRETKALRKEQGA